MSVGAGQEGCLDYPDVGPPGAGSLSPVETSTGRRDTARLAIGKLGSDADPQAKSVDCTRVQGGEPGLLESWRRGIP